MRTGRWSTTEVQLNPNVRGTSPEDRKSTLEEAICIGGVGQLWFWMEEKYHCCETVSLQC